MSGVRFIDHDGLHRLANELRESADRIARIKEHFSEDALPDDFGGLYFGPVIRPTYQQALGMSGRRIVEHSEVVRTLGDRVELALGDYERNASELIAELVRQTALDEPGPASKSTGGVRKGTAEGIR